MDDNPSYQVILFRNIIAPSLLKDDNGWYLPAVYSDGTTVNSKELKHYPTIDDALYELTTIKMNQIKSK